MHLFSTNLTAFLLGSLAVAMLTVQSARAGDVVRTPRLVSEHVVDCTSVETIIAGIIKPDMTPRQKAEAVYEFVRQYRWHWGPSHEGPESRRGDFEYGIIYDPVNLIAVYGYGYCFQTAGVLESLYRAAGLEARRVGLTGHTTCEVFYDGAYHFYDSDQQGFCRLADGQSVASIADLERDPLALILNQPNKSTPYFPAGANPRVPYESKVIATSLFAARYNHHFMWGKYDVAHRMDDLTLAPGMKFVRYFEPKGAWYYVPKDNEGDMKMGYLDAAVGPADPFSNKTYGNGVLQWQPDLSSATNEYRAGVWQDSNIAQDEHGIRPTEAGSPAYAIFRVRLPYVIVGWPGSWTENKPVGAAVVAAKILCARPGDRVAISVSIDGGATWKKVWKSPNICDTKALVDLSEQVVGQYEYLVRLELSARKQPADCRVDQLTINTTFQCNPAALPALRDGRTKMRFALGDQTETLEVTPDLMTAEGVLRDATEIRNLVLSKPGRLVSRPGTVGELVYELAPPKPGTPVGYNIVAGCRCEPGRLRVDDDVKIYYAENEPRDWKLLSESDVPDYQNHWSYYQAAQGKCAAGTNRIYVKFAVHTTEKAALGFVRLRLYWQPEPAGGAAGLPVRGVRIEHAWAEGGVEKNFETIAKDAPTDYVVNAGKGVVNKSVTIEPVRAPGLKWRTDDAMVELPHLPAPQLVDAALRDELRRLLRGIDADPKKFLPEAAASNLVWLATSARQAMDMFNAKYPLPEPAFGDAILARAGRLLNPTSPPDVADDDVPPAKAAPGPPPAPPPSACKADASRLAEKLRASSDPGDRIVLAAAMELLGVREGSEELAKAIKALNGKPSPALPGGAAVLLRSDHPAGKVVAEKIMAGPDRYAKVRFLETLRLARLTPLPAELLVGLSDASRWVRLNTLVLCRGENMKSPAVREAVSRIAKDDPVQFLREEAAGMMRN